MIRVETDNRKLAQFVAQKLADGWVVTGICMTGPEVDHKSGCATAGVLIDRGCWRWVDYRQWRSIFKRRVQVQN